MGLVNGAFKKLKRTVASKKKEAHQREVEKQKEERKRKKQQEKAFLEAEFQTELANLNEYFSAKAQAEGKHAFFSIVIAMYNAEEFIEETIRSILNQSAGCNHTQIIIVDDGSTDGSAEIIMRLVAERPDVIEYHYQENQGVSAARNYGMSFQDGLYVGFLDSDDKYAKNTLFETMKFARDHEDMKVLAMRTKFFDSKVGAHPLNYICAKDAVVDLRTDFDLYPLSAARSIFHYSALESRQFRTDLRYTEDSFIVHEIMLSGEPVFGAMAKPCYYYRKREVKGSASDQSQTNPCWYTETLVNGHMAIMDKALETKGCVEKYIQYAVMYDLYWRLRNEVDTDIFDEEFISEYKDTIQKLIENIDDDVILSVRNFDITLRIYAYALKHGHDFEELLSNLTCTDEGLILHAPQADGSEAMLQMKNTDDWNRVTIDVISYDRKRDTLVLDGRMPYARFNPNQIDLRFFDGEKAFDAELFVYPHGRMRIGLSGAEMNSQTSFKICIPLQKSGNISAYASLNGSAPVVCNFSYGKFSRLNGGFKISAFAILKRKCLIGTDEEAHKLNYAHITDFESELSKLEKRFEEDLKLSQKGKKCISIRRKAVKHILKRPDERIWLFTDRVTSAEDSGEVMFRHVINNPIENVRPIFVIREDVPDYERLKAVGEVVAAGSEEHLLATLCAERIISSSADEWVINPFEKNYNYVKDLLDFDFIFLQHGVIKESLADWLYISKKNIRLFVTSAPRERQSIIEGDYGYGPDQIILTGLPRWDNFAKFKNESKRVIFFMPTWRSYLSPKTNWNSEDAEDTSSQVDWFSDTRYYQVLNSVLEDPRLHSLLEKHDYVLKFAPHPRVGSAYSLFTSSDRIELLKPESFEYAQAFKDMSMLITDYSSTAFNVAIMEKPIAYIQFDKEEFYEGHTGTKDYFDYELDGFGPVAETKNQLIDIIEHNLSEGMKMNELYLDRVHSFFFMPPNGETRASLVMNEILKLDSE